jgi:hypothetical protein
MIPSKKGLAILFLLRNKIVVIAFFVNLAKISAFLAVWYFFGLNLPEIIVAWLTTFGNLDFFP